MDTTQMSIRINQENVRMQTHWTVNILEKKGILLSANNVIVITYPSNKRDMETQTVWPHYPELKEESNPSMGHSGS